MKNKKQHKGNRKEMVTHVSDLKKLPYSNLNSEP